MNANLLNIVKQIAADYGEEILGDAQRLRAFFGDLAKDEPKPLRVAFGRCIEEGAYTALKTAANKAERAERKTQIAQRVFDEHGLAESLCAEALDILEAAILQSALFEGKQEPPHCASCGKELQPEWKSCPFCGAAAEVAVTSETAATEIGTSPEEWGTPVAPVMATAAPSAPATTVPKEPVVQKTASAVFVKIAAKKKAEPQLQSNENESNGNARSEGITDSTGNQQPQPESDEENEAQKKHEGEIGQLKKILKKTKSGLAAAIIAGIIALAVSIGFGVSQYNNLMIDYNSQFAELSSVKIEKNHLKELVNSFEYRWSINVTSIKVGNSNNDKQLATPGTSLKARDMRYLTPEITYNSLVSRNVTFYMKIIDPDGDIFRNRSISPKGYSYSSDKNVTRGSNQKLELSGWGNGDSSSYWAGTWTVEVWFEGVCLRSEKVRLN